MSNSLRNFKIYFLFLGKEFISPLNYFMALLIGVTINYFQGIGIFASPVPFIVPVIVQAFSKSSVKFGNRNMKLLVRLPSEKKDPAFVINPEGEIIASEGKTKDFFGKHGFKSIYDFFKKEDVTFLSDVIDKSCQSSGYHHSELYAEQLNKWYSIHFKRDTYSNNLLVWFDDISMRKKLDKKIATLRDFSKQILFELHSPQGADTSLDKLASFVLDEGYRGIFIACKDNDENLAGHVYKMPLNKVVKSEKIVIDKNSDAPIWNSRRDFGVVSDNIGNYNSQEEFEKTRPFDVRVKEFLGFKISNFINYHEDDVSVIIFNNANEISQNDLIFMETIVSSAFTTNYLKNLIQKRA